MGECRDCAYSGRPIYKWPCDVCRATKNGRSMYCPEEADHIAADVRPVAHGRWIELENPDYSPFDPTSQEYELLCSNCGATHYGADRNFCPACGADMRPRKESET